MIIYLLIIIACSTNSSKWDSQQTDNMKESIEDLDTHDVAANDTALSDSEDTSSPTDTNNEPGSIPEDDPWEDVSLHDSIFQSTHNSYSGEEKGSIIAQLNNGVRGLELDIHDNDFQNWGDYLIGHGSHGSEVDHHGDNPDTILLRDWLEIIDNWSTQHPDHAPITITLDLKDNLTDNYSHATGSFSALNELLEDIFSEKLVPVSSSLPSLGTLRGKIIIVLSGDETSRKLYKRDKGHHPAIAINASGQVIEVHDSGSGHLWYWTGQLQSDGKIEWYRHGRYDTGSLPAIALNNDGFFVEVHKSESQQSLWYRTGYLDTQYLPHFSESMQFDSGTEPSIRFENKNGTLLREIHISENTGLSWDWEMELNQSNLSLQL